MSEGDLFGLQKMGPMARRALASMEAMIKAIDFNNRNDIEKHLNDAKNALSSLGDDLALHDSLTKAMSKKTNDALQLGAIRKFDNTEGDLSVNDGALALGVVRAGRTDRVFRPHEVY